eukprot:gene9224-1310_t
MNQKKKKAVLVKGFRTPFVKAFGDFLELDAIELGSECVKGLISKTQLDPELVDEIIWGNVVQNNGAPNIAREIIFDSKLPTKITGKTISKGCLSGLEAILQGVDLIENGNAHVVLAGGSDSVSSSEIILPKHMSQALGKYQYSKTKGISSFVTLVKDVGLPWTWIPKPPKIEERTTGKSMGYHADLMGEINEISREEQDIFALISHANATKARKDGILKEEIIPIELKNGKVVSKDEIIREKGSLSDLNKLKTAFREKGTVSAGNSSALTDGASVVLIMSEEKALELGYEIDIIIESMASSAIDPNPQLLLAPALAIPKCLKKANLKLEEIDFVEMHEAFGAQVLSTLACLESEDFSKKYLNQTGTVGRISPENLNINGGSLAIGHPFSATGGRLVTSAINEMRRNNKERCLISICAAGGLGGCLKIMSYVNSSLYVGDLQPDANEALLYEVFREIGPIVSIKVCRDVMTSKSLGYAYVNFQNAEDAASAIERLNFSEVKGKPIRIMYVQRDPAVRKSGLGNIFIKNLDESIDNKTLYDTFSLFGNILSCKVSAKRYEVTGTDGKPEIKEQRLGYGFVHFDSEEAADMAIQKVDGMLIAGKQVQVTKFVKKHERTKGSEELYTNVFLKDLDVSVDDKTLQKFYEKYGEVTSCLVSQDKDGKSKQFGFINFKDAEAAHKAVEDTNGKIIEGLTSKDVPLYAGKAEKKEDRVHKLKTEYEKKKQESIQKYQGLNVYVKNLDDSVDDEKLKGLFDEFGKITSCVVMKDETGASKGFGFICFSTPEESIKAITEMHTKIILNKPLYVTLAQRKELRRQELEQQYKQRQQGIVRPGMQQMYPGPQVFYGQPMQRQMMYPNQQMGGPKPRWTQNQQNQQKSQKPGKKQRNNQKTSTKQPTKEQQGGDVKYKDNVRNKQQPVKQQKPVQQVQTQQVQQSGNLSATYLANLSPRSQKQTLGETLFPMVHQQQPDLASKITGMLLEMDNGDILHLLESNDALNAKVAEAVTVLKQHQEIEKDE